MYTYTVYKIINIIKVYTNILYSYICNLFIAKLNFNNCIDLIFLPNIYIQIIYPCPLV